ncbi:MAG: hypothetical protein K5987_00395 [Lachnospiraceae bacterium]|jgi:hypothetical protein|nr:hypothetical protein [Lachnospiraceae bacterium]MCR4936604.1 hypothetical protein [Lachnospiraceae bacterium]
MIEFDPALFLSPALKKERFSLCERFIKGDKVKGLYVIYMNMDTGKPEAMKSEELDKKYYREKMIHVTGIADGRESVERYLAYAAMEYYGL